MNCLCATGSASVTKLLNRLFRTFHGCRVDFLHPIDQAVIGHGNGVGIEGVSGDDIGPGFEERPMDGGNRIRPCNREQVVAALQIPGMIGKLRTSKFRLAETELLNHRTHRPVEDQNALGEKILETFKIIRLQIRHCEFQISRPFFSIYSLAADRQYRQTMANISIGP